MKLQEKMKTTMIKKVDYEKREELCMQSGGLCSVLAIYINFASVCEEIYSENNDITCS